MNCGELATITSQEFASYFIPNYQSISIKAIDFIKSRSHSEAIEAAIFSAKNVASTVAIILDSQDWLIDRAILLPTNRELIIDGCLLKLANGVFDNIIRVAGLIPNIDEPNGQCITRHPTKNFKIKGLNGAVLEGPDIPYFANNPKTGVYEKWVGDFFGWRTIGILISGASNYEISNLTLQKMQCWAISQDQSSYGYLHDLVFNTDVKNGDGIDFRNGCSFSLVDNISGTTSDDTIACTALDDSFMKERPKYIYPMQPMGFKFQDAESANIHDIVIRNIFTGGEHHSIICLATTPTVYNILIENVREEKPSAREASVKIYTGYGKGYIKGNLRNISVSNVISTGSKYAVMVKAAVKDVYFSNITQLKLDAEVYSIEGDSENLII